MGNSWKNCKLGNLVNIKNKSVTPKANDDLPYIGLEHIEPETLRLKGVGSSREVTSNKYLFNKGDILFGKLRPYFRKVYRSKFSGICSTDISVIEAKNHDVNQAFLFYLISSWDFINIATKSSKGTKMPRADWNYLIKLNLKIPSKIEQ